MKIENLYQIIIVIRITNQVKWHHIIHQMKRPVQVSSGAGGQERSLELDNSGTGGQEAALVSSQTLTRPEGVEPGQENISYNLYIYDKKK